MHNNTAPLQSIDINEPFAFWAMDYMGPLPEISSGSKPWLVVMDHFTKWCEVFPTKDQNVSTIADILVTRVFSRLGPPTIIHSDQGRNLKVISCKRSADLWESISHEPQLISHNAMVSLSGRVGPSKKS